jgi:hypothetical protein
MVAWLIRWRSRHISLARGKMPAHGMEAHEKRRKTGRRAIHGRLKKGRRTVGAVVDEQMARERRLVDADGPHVQVVHLQHTWQCAQVRMDLCRVDVLRNA